MTRSPATRSKRKINQTTRVIVCCLLAWVLPGLPALAQPATRAVKFHPDSSYTAESLLRNAASHSRDKQWDQAIEILERVLRQHGGSMAQVPRDPDDPLGGESTLFVDVKQYCQSQLATMPPEALATYRRKVDPQAERWYREGLSSRRLEPLRRVVEEAFCSSWGDQAIDLLGDLAFQEGRFSEAIALYRRLVPDPDRPATSQLYPGPDVDLAQVAAKILLARAAVNRVGPPLADLEAYARQYPDAAGNLAGRKGPYLVSLIEALKADGLAPEPAPDGRWPTFAGSASRSFVAPGAVDVGSFQWKVKLTPVEPGRDMNPNFMMNRRFTGGVVPSTGDRELAYHPIVVGDQVVICEANRLVAYNLNDRPEGATSDDNEVPVVWEQSLTSAFSTRAARVMPASPRYTVTSHGDRIYARLGSPHSRMGPSFIVAVRNNREVEGKLLWKKSSSDIQVPQPQGAAGRASVSFEGTPVADDRNVYVALSESGTMTSSYIACLDAESGDLRWLRFLGQATSDVNLTMGFPFGDEVGNRLLSLEGSTIYYQTNLGAVAALDAETGAIRWLATYPPRDQRGSASKRELTPAVIDKGLVIIAPDDAPEIFAFDSANGRLVWKSQPLPEATHLLGVIDNRIVATGNRVWLIDTATGKIAGFWPQGGAGLEGYGRGLLAGGLIYWPTRTEIRVLDPKTGLEAPSGPIALQQAFGTGGGNLAVGDGYLVIAQTDSLLVFCQNRRLIDRYREQIAVQPDKPINYLRLARVAEATGQDELAIENLALALDKSRPGDLIDGKPLAAAAHDQQYRILMRLGDRAINQKTWPEAVRWFQTAAAAAAATDKDRLAAQLRLATAQEGALDLNAATLLLHQVLADESLRHLPVVAGASRTVRADRLIAEQLSRLLKQHGRDLYRPFDDKALALYQRGRAERDPHLLEEVARSYPAAQVVPDSLLALAALEEEQGRPAAAARAYKRLLAIAPGDDTTSARALLGLARVYERQNLLVPARDAYVQAQSRFAELRLDELEGSVGSHVTERLNQHPLEALTADRSQPPLPAPLTRRWNVRWPSPAHPLAADGVPPSPAAGRIFLVEETQIRPINPTSGAYAWSAELGAEPRWVGYLSDHVIAATENRLVALDLETGTIRWTFEGGNQQPDQNPRNPFARPAPAQPDADKAADAATPGPLHDFRIVSNRVYLLRGQSEILAIDGDSGLLDWSFRPDQGFLHDRWSADTSRIILQRREPNALVVLDPETGVKRADFPQSPEVQLWARDPWPVDDDHVALVTDPRTVALFDLQRGVEAWSYREPSSLPRSGPPRLLGDAGRLLVLRDGSELVRLDPATGQKLWSRILGLEDLAESPQALAIDADRVFCASGPAPTLTAYRLTDGEPVWKRHLSGPKKGWTLALSDRFLIAYPDPMRCADDSLQSLPLLLCARDDGRLLQRFLLGSTVTDLSVRLTPGLALVATQDAGWALGARESETLDGEPQAP